MVGKRPVLEPCCNCGKLPIVRRHAGDLYYAQCNCGKWSPYEALGFSEKSAIEHWNDLNRPIDRKGNPRGIDNEM